jgi:hypothetical protein
MVDLIILGDQFEGFLQFEVRGSLVVELPHRHLNLLLDAEQFVQVSAVLDLQGRVVHRL